MQWEKLFFALLIKCLPWEVKIIYLFSFFFLGEGWKLCIVYFFGEGGEKLHSLMVCILLVHIVVVYTLSMDPLIRQWVITMGYYVFLHVESSFYYFAVKYIYIYTSKQTHINIYIYTHFTTKLFNFHFLLKIFTIIFFPSYMRVFLIKIKENYLI